MSAKFRQVLVKRKTRGETRRKSLNYYFLRRFPVFLRPNPKLLFMHPTYFSPNIKGSERKQIIYEDYCLVHCTSVSNLLQAPITPLYANIISDYRKTMHKKEQDLPRLLSLELWTRFAIGQNARTITNMFLTRQLSCRAKPTAHFYNKFKV